ncbi:hypothetical protein ACFL2H_08205 [Planctomycetota bacterium]
MKVAKVEWQTSVRTTVVHALRALSSGSQLVNREMEDAVRPFLSHLPTNSTNTSDRWDAMVAQALLPNCSDDLISQSERAVLQACPNTAEQLRLRVRPIQEQWETCGPGLLTAIGKRIGATQPKEELPTVVLVQPVLGGAATAYPKQDLVVMEAVLANPHQELPEILRLAWGLTQLLSNPQWPATDSNNRHIHELAVIPICIAEGESFGLCNCDRATMALASEIWPSPDFRPASIDVLWDWWLATETNTDWSQRLKALSDRLSWPNS